MTQNPNNRRRLTADELIALLVALAGIGTILWWALTHRQVTVSNNSASTTLPADNGGELEDPNNIVQTFPLTASPAARRAVSGSPLPRSSNNDATLQPPLVAPVPVPPSALPDSASTSLDAAVPVVPATKASPSAAPLAATAPTAQPSPTSSTPAFTDVPDKYWGKDYITVLKERGVLDDFGSGKFDPNAPITRGEYAKMLDRAFDRPVSQQVLEFKDIPTSYPRRVALDKAVKMGFMSGYSPTKFAPDEKIPRYQMQISLAKGMNLTIPADAEKTLAKYADVQALPKYARPKMGAAIASGFVIKDGQNTKLQPVKSATRGEAAALVYEALVKDGQIPAGK
jgi:S-layer homology domain